ncbi:MAG: hypothetical protein OXC07_08515 [Kistimonas sp.]|nr:hypothetical protein [Kistimonas sp.]
MSQYIYTSVHEESAGRSPQEPEGNVYQGRGYRQFRRLRGYGREVVPHPGRPERRNQFGKLICRPRKNRPVRRFLPVDIESGNLD